MWPGDVIALISCIVCTCSFFFAGISVIGFYKGDGDICSYWYRGSNYKDKSTQYTSIMGIISLFFALVSFGVGLYVAIKQGRLNNYRSAGGVLMNGIQTAYPVSGPIVQGVPVRQAFGKGVKKVLRRMRFGW